MDTIILDRGWNKVYGGIASEIWKNYSANTAYGIGPGQVSINGDGGATSTVRWTAPDTGTVDIVGSFGPGDWGIGYRGVFLNNQLEWASNYGQAGSFNLGNLTVIAGSTLGRVVNEAR